MPSYACKKYIFHLLSTTDLTNVRQANAHFSEDILSVLLNEPIPGQGVFWSSVGGPPYPVSIRVLSFEHRFTALDPTYNRSAADTFAQALKAKFQDELVQRLEPQERPTRALKNEITAQNDD